MKIALISHLYPTKLSPHNGKFIQDQLTLLDKQPDIDIDLLVPTPYSLPFTTRWETNHSDLLCHSSHCRRVRYISLPKKRFPYIIRRSLSRNLINTLARQSYDLVHVHWLYPDGFSIPALKKAGYKTLLTIHGSDWYKNIKKPKLIPFIKKTLESVDRILYSGPDLKKDIEAKFPFVSSKSEIIYNWVDEKKYISVNDQTKKIYREQLGWNESKLHVLTVANIRYEKGVDLLVDAIHSNQELKEVNFHIIGNPENTEFSNSILQKIKSNTHSNIFFENPVHPEALIRHYQSADLYILPSRKEGFGLALVEACFTGLPFIATKVGIAPELENLNLGLTVLEEELSKITISDIKSVLKLANPLSTSILLDKFGSHVFKNRLMSIYESVLDD